MATCERRAQRSAGGWRRARLAPRKGRTGRQRASGELAIEGQVNPWLTDQVDAAGIGAGSAGDVAAARDVGPPAAIAVVALGIGVPVIVSFTTPLKTGGDVGTIGLGPLSAAPSLPQPAVSRAARSTHALNSGSRARAICCRRRRSSAMRMATSSSQ